MEQWTNLQRRAEPRTDTLIEHVEGKSRNSNIGEWRHSKAEGYGVRTQKNGDRYEGEWKQSMKHG